MNTKKVITLVSVSSLIALISLLLIGRPTGFGLNTHEIDITPGMSVGQAAKLLAEKKILQSPKLFKFYLQIRGNSKIQRGVYELNDSMTVYEVAENLYQGKVKTLKITIPEGWHNRQIAQYLIKKKIVKNQKEFMAITKDKEQLKPYGLQNSEGYLYPETYHVPYHFTAFDLHQLMLDTFFQNVSEFTDLDKISPKKLREKVILASIIEREAFMPVERPIIARVFLNRIDKGMKLESCATVQYLFPASKKKLFFKDLKKPSRYNTYIHQGYPPGPISNPGRASLQAAFQPEKTDYLFFVVKPDRSHYFSKTYTDHLKAKEKYIHSDVIWEVTTN